MMTVFPDWGLSEARTFARSGHRHCEWLARFLAGGAFHSACGFRQFEEAGVNASEGPTRGAEARQMYIRRAT